MEEREQGKQSRSKQPLPAKVEQTQQLWLRQAPQEAQNPQEESVERETGIRYATQQQYVWPESSRVLRCRCQP